MSFKVCTLTTPGNVIFPLGIYIYRFHYSLTRIGRRHCKYDDDGGESVSK
jgi:hypothetical protein